jgi:hypothetical protein
MSHYRKHNILAIAFLALLAVFAPSPASASNPFDNGEDTFANSTPVSDKDLAGMRGGFLDINGVLIDFNFFSNVEVGMNTISNINIDAATLAQIAQSANVVQEVLQPSIIQNMDNNTLISIQQAINLSILNPEQFNALSQVAQLSYIQAAGIQ